MNRKQYYRLTTVLFIPFIAFSWWLPQQDFFIERGKSIACDVSRETYADEGFCSNFVYKFPIAKFPDISQAEGDLKLIPDGEVKIIYLQNFNLPIKATYYDALGRYVVSSKINVYTLNDYGCRLTMDSLKNNWYTCYGEYASLSKLSLGERSGRFEFINQDDENKYRVMVDEAMGKFKKLEDERTLWSFLVFTCIIFAYFILSFLIKFIIYGIGKKEPNA